MHRHPPAWIIHLARGGVIVTDLRGSLAGGLVRLTRADEEDDDVVEGSFLGVAGASMPLRGALGSPHRDGEVWDRPLDMINPQRGLTVADPGLLTEDGLRLVVQLHLGGECLRGFLPDDGVAWSGRAADGSWFSVDTASRSDGLRAVVQGGPQRLWDTVETATRAWERLGRPSVGTFRVTNQDHPALRYVTVDCDPALGWHCPSDSTAPPVPQAGRGSAGGIGAGHRQPRSLSGHAFVVTVGRSAAASFTDVPAEQPVTVRHQDGVTAGSSPAADAAVRAARASVR